ncbi:MAG: hypothetical protein LQ344_004648 [Seirophora lacunosa]|nr:MAG: hypothetical protein LQ344_004648 [Seirophora lacunosa]
MASEETCITLSPLDYIPPRNYVRIIFPIPLTPDVEHTIVFNDLREALHKTFVQEPWLSGKVFRQPLDAEGWRPGQLEIRHHPYPSDGERPHQLKYMKLDTKPTYNELRAAGFPSGIWPEQHLLQAPILGEVDVAGADILLAQANFLPGGMLLGMTTCHAAADGSSMLNITKMWAENFRELHERDAGGKIAPSHFSPSDNDRQLAEKIWQRDGTLSRDASNDPWLRTLACLDADYPGEDPTGKTQKAAIAAAANPNGKTHNLTNGQTSRPMINKIMFMSSHDLTSLRQTCALEPLPPNSSPLSISDAINALFWRGLMRVRAQAAKARSQDLDPISVFESPVDVRDVFGKDFPPTYMGNCWLLNSARMPLSELIAPSTPLGRVAQSLRQGAANVDISAVHAAYALLRSTPDLSKIQGRFVERPDSADILLSNIMHLPLAEINFGDRYFGNGGVPHTMRILHGDYTEGVRLGHVLPRSAKHGGVELSVNLFADEWACLEGGEEVGRYMMVIEPEELNGRGGGEDGCCG